MRRWTVPGPADAADQHAVRIHKPIARRFPIYFWWRFESEHITRYDVRTVNDLVTVAPGSFTGSYFGVPGSLFVRGEPGDNFFRGFRRVENRGNYATPVAATDHIEIVKGPPSPAYGGGKIGGFLNFLPKSARARARSGWNARRGRVR